MTKLDKARAALREAEASVTRTSHRAWRKGSARGAGPQAQTGTVQVKREPVQLDATPLDHHGRKLHVCGHCGRWAPSFPLFCACMAKCATCGEWHSTAAGVELHTCGRGAA